MSGEGTGWAELLSAAEAIRAQAIEREPDLRRSRIVAIAWATVDADRARGELDALLGAGTWAPADPDPILGASVWRRGPMPSAPADEAPLLVVEPTTEGRLAAFLAKFGEGVAAVHVDLQEPDGVDGRVARGAARLVTGGPPWGPHVIVASRR